MRRFLIGLVIVGVTLGVVLHEERAVGSDRPDRRAAHTRPVTVGSLIPEAAGALSPAFVVPMVEWLDGIARAEWYAGVQRALDAEAERAALAAQRAQPSGRVNGNPTYYSSGSVWDDLAQCESGGNWSINTGNGFTGGLQFVTSTWLSNGGGQYAPEAYLATPEQQIEIAENLRAARGFAPWPGCRAKLGLP